jgi:hypothetical protein
MDSAQVRTARAAVDKFRQPRKMIVQSASKRKTVSCRGNVRMSFVGPASEDPLNRSCIEPVRNRKTLDVTIFACTVLRTSCSSVESWTLFISFKPTFNPSVACAGQAELFENFFLASNVYSEVEHPRMLDVS